MPSSSTLASDDRVRYELARSRAAAPAAQPPQPVVGLDRALAAVGEVAAVELEQLRFGRPAVAQAFDARTASGP